MSQVEPSWPPLRIVNNNHNGELLKIGDFAKVAGTNLRTLRYYEELGLLAPAQRSDGGFRYYRPSDVNRVRAIHFLQDLGLNLERIGELLDTRLAEGSDRGAWVQRVHTALSEQQRLIDGRIAQLEEQKLRLGQAAQKLALCSECDHHPSQANNFCDPCERTGDPLPELLSALF